MTPTLLELADAFDALSALIRRPPTPDPVEPTVPMPLAVNAAGLQLIKDSEGIRLKAYQDVAGVWTIGWGHTSGVTQGQVISQAQADVLLVQDLAIFTNAVAMASTAPTDNQFSAMVSLAYNIGVGGFKSSTVLRKHNAGDFAGAAAAFALWNKAGGAVLPALVTRRAKEAALYSTP